MIGATPENIVRGSLQKRGHEIWISKTEGIHDIICIFKCCFAACATASVLSGFSFEALVLVFGFWFSCFGFRPMGVNRHP